MPRHKSWNRAFAVAGVALFMLLHLTGCAADTGTPSPPQLRVGISNTTIVTVTKWAVSEGTLNYRGATRVTLSGSDGTGSPRSVVGQPVSVFLPSSRINALQGSIAGLVNRFVQRDQPPREGRQVTLMRPGLAGKMIEYESSDGRKSGVQFSGRSTDGRPPLAAAYYEEGQLRMLVETAYRRTSRGWEASKSRSLSFDSAGSIQQVLVYDFDEPTEYGWAGASKGLKGIVASAAQVCRGAFQAVLPTALYAEATSSGILAIDPEDVPEACTSQWWNYAAAWGYVLAAEAAVVVACAGCPVTGAMCPACAAAWAALAAAALDLTAATVALDECRTANQPPPPGGGGGGGGGGGSGNLNCYTLYWWASVDGGLTWFFSHSETTCYYEDEWET